MKKILSVVLVAIFAVVLTVPTFASVATKQDAKDAKSVYVNYYDNTYVPAYHAYNQKLADLSEKIKNTNFTTVEQAQRVIDFLNGLKTAKDDFFGTRTTTGKSRDVVPALRDKMDAEYTAGNYAAAIDFCTQLKAAVALRVGFLNEKAALIDDFQIIVPDHADASIQFTVTDYTPWWTNFIIVVTNNSDSAITNWSLSMNYSGDINYIGLKPGTGGYNGFGTFCYSAGYGNSKDSGVFTVSPSDNYQAGYTIPAHTSITLIGNGASVNGVSSATIGGKSADVTFTK